MEGAGERTAGVCVCVSHFILALDEKVQNVLANHIKVLVQKLVHLHHKPSEK